MKPDTPLVTMRGDERICFDRAMDQWLASIKRLDLSEKDRVKGALLAYQRQAFVFHEQALLEAHQRGRREGMEEAARHMDDRASEWRNIGNVTSNTFANIYEDEAAAIRAKMEDQP